MMDDALREESGPDIVELEDGITRFETLGTVQRNCPCGCEQMYPVYWGRMTYGAYGEFVFAVAHLRHRNGGPHAWLQLGSGPWFDDDRPCLITLHVYVDDSNILTSIQDPQESPFWPPPDAGPRLLTRAEVLSREGGKEWAVARRLDLERHHPPTAQFLRAG